MKQKKLPSLENLMQQHSEVAQKKVLHLILRADMQGSLEALKNALGGITSDKAETNIIFSAVGEVSEADVDLAAASKAMIIGFHTQVERHAEGLIKELNIQIFLHDVIYRTVERVKEVMTGLLDKLIEEKVT